MRKLLIYLICGLMTLGMFLPSIVKAADPSDDMVTISFEGKYADGKTMTIKKGSKITSADTEKLLSKKGYSYYGTFTDAAFKNRFDYNTVIENNITLYPDISLVKYNIYFYKNEDSKTKYLGRLNNYVSVENPQMPTLEKDFYNLFDNKVSDYKNPRTGKVYTFAEVYDINGFRVSGYDYKSLNDVPELQEKHLENADVNSISVEFLVKKKKLTVTFVPGNGKDNFTIEASFGEWVKKSPKDPTRDGYKFLGWYDGDKVFTLPTSKVYEDTTLTAKWEKEIFDKYKVSFVLEGEDIKDQEVEFDTNATKPKVDPKEGYEFDGWYTDSGFTSKFDFSSPIKSNLTLYARWKKKKYTVSFVLEGEEISNQNVEFDSQAAEPKIETREGFEFDGWYTDPKFTNKFNFSSPIKSNLTLYARWKKKKYTVSFVLEGEEISNQNVEFDSQAAEPKIETREGFEFDGWYTDSEFKKEFDFSSPIKSNLTLYARWNKIETENPNPDETEEPGDDKDPDENPGETEEPGEDEKENPDDDKKPEDNKDSDDQKNPDIDDNPNKNNRPSYDYNYDYYDYYWHPNYDYLNSNRNNSSDIAKNKDDKDEEKTKDENKEETIEEKVTIPEAILNSYFSDIGDLPGHYQEAIIDLANRSVLIGTGKNNFDPHTIISRAMVDQVLYRLANDKTYVNPSDFTDVSPTNWFYTAVNWANEKGLVKGFKDKTFKPNKSITNEELAVILARAIEKLELKTSNINSINKDDYKFLSDWNRDGIIKMLELELMDFSFEGKQVVVKEISRAEFANIIYKLINSLN
ncbi:InlB B-repeat-containing protein [Ezakiella peruensis]|uniref:InlB B-repeat-containing protein n=1 Tax=Ezakiella peruensis TaxID=1464038 RepID=UPI000C1B15C2|nr:InlB B-repeat-containing protein [Ezakiella peruensis]